VHLDSGFMLPYSFKTIMREGARLLLRDAEG